MATQEQIDMLKDFFAPENAEELEVIDEYRALAADLIKDGLIWVMPGDVEAKHVPTAEGQRILDELARAN